MAIGYLWLHLPTRVERWPVTSRHPAAARLESPARRPAISAPRWLFPEKHAGMIARGRDACDVPMLHTFGPHILKTFRVITERIEETVLETAA